MARGGPISRERQPVDKRLQGKPLVYLPDTALMRRAPGEPGGEAELQQQLIGCGAIPGGKPDALMGRDRFHPAPGIFFFRVAQMITDDPSNGPSVFASHKAVGIEFSFCVTFNQTIRNFFARICYYMY